MGNLSYPNHEEVAHDVSANLRNTSEVFSETGRGASKASADLQADRPPLTRRDVVIAVGRGPVALIEEILDIELCLPGLVDRRKDPGVEANEARQLHGVVGRGERIREVNDPKGGGPDRSDLILVPPRELMKRNELNAVAREDGRRRVAGNPSVGIGVAKPGLPIVGQIALQFSLEPANCVAARQDEKSGSVRVGQRNMGALEVIDGDRTQEMRECLAYDADFIVYEFLWRQNHGAVVERAELVARGGQIRDHVR